MKNILRVIWPLSRSCWVDSASSLRLNSRGSTIRFCSPWVPKRPVTMPLILPKYSLDESKMPGQWAMTASIRRSSSAAPTTSGNHEYRTPQRGSVRMAGWLSNKLCTNNEPPLPYGWVTSKLIRPRASSGPVISRPLSMRPIPFGAAPPGPDRPPGRLRCRPPPTDRDRQGADGQPAGVYRALQRAGQMQTVALRRRQCCADAFHFGPTLRREAQQTHILALYLRQRSRLVADLGQSAVSMQAKGFRIEQRVAEALFQ